MKFDKKIVNSAILVQTKFGLESQCPEGVGYNWPFHQFEFATFSLQYLLGRCLLLLVWNLGAAAAYHKT